MSIQRNNTPTQSSLLTTLAGYYLIPHELLHVLAFRILGKPYQYEWGQFDVRPLAPETKGERLFVSLFPFGVIVGLGVLFGLLWVASAFFINIPPDQYFTDGPTWHIIFLIISCLFFFYSTSASDDLISSFFVLLLNKDIEDNSPSPHQRSDKQQHQGQ